MSQVKSFWENIKGSLGIKVNEKKWHGIESRYH
jgi:hypothetical protein